MCIITINVIQSPAVVISLFYRKGNTASTNLNNSPCSEAIFAL